MRQRNRPEDSAASAPERIAAALIQDISQGRVAPGVRLDEMSLAKRFGVSRTPVREALNRLVAKQILVNRGRRGVAVAEISREDLAQMFEAMSEMEALCARLAAQRMPLLLRSRMEEAQRNCVKAAEENNREAYLEHNEQFHYFIYQGTQNQYIEEMATLFRQRTGPFRSWKFRSQEDLLRSAEGHAAIIALIGAARFDDASTEMRRHVMSNNLRILAEYEELDEAS